MHEFRGRHLERGQGKTQFASGALEAHVVVHVLMDLKTASTHAGMSMVEEESAVRSANMALDARMRHAQATCQACQACQANHLDAFGRIGQFVADGAAGCAAHRQLVKSTRLLAGLGLRKRAGVEGSSHRRLLTKRLGGGRHGCAFGLAPQDMRFKRRVR